MPQSPAIGTRIAEDVLQPLLEDFHIGFRDRALY
jgi:hypothetical protein